MADYAIHEETLVDVSNVIRKKDGTSALIDPADYADRINLMGMLEEKTVSSSPIVAFSDGADAVPLKKCEITLPASLDGYSSVSAKCAGTSYGTFTNGYGIGLDGLPQPTANRVATLTPIAIDPDTTYKVYSETNQKFIIGVINNGTLVRRTANISSGANIDTSGGTDLYVCMYNAQNNKVTVEDDKPIVFNSTETITTHTASLGRTIHGGSVDVVAGQGVDEDRLYTVDNTASVARQSGYQSAFYYFNLVLPADADTAEILLDKISNIFDPLPFSGAGGIYRGNTGACQRSGYITFYHPDLAQATIDEAKAWLISHDAVFIYQLATPEPFTFDPISIDSKLGNNTIWSEQGDTEVTYRSQGTVYQYPEGEGVSF